MNEYRVWAISIFCWDGLLPLVIAAITSLLIIICPGNDAIEVAFAVAAPIAGFFIRLWIGGRHFETHPHYAWQGVVFFIAVLWLILLDCMWIIFQQLRQLEHVRPDEWLPVLFMYLTYLAFMAIALYPLRSDQSDESSDGH